MESRIALSGDPINDAGSGISDSAISDTRSVTQCPPLSSTAFTNSSSVASA
jgi:hypothetical protein